MELVKRETENFAEETDKVSLIVIRDTSLAKPDSRDRARVWLRRSSPVPG